MMDNRLEAYVKIYRAALSTEECDKTVEELKQNEWVKGTFYSNRTDSEDTYEKTLDMSSDSIPSSEMLMKRIWDVLFEYTDELHYEWFSSWDYYSPIRFNRYGPETFMKKHCDHIHSMFDGTVKGVPILTVLGLLNDDFKGGELIMFDDTVVPLFKGDIVVFPSNFLYPHQVKALTEGERFSFVSWAA